MNKLLTAIAPTIALPAVAHDQTTLSPRPVPAGHDMKGLCCNGMDHSKVSQQPDVKPADATAHQNHQH